MKIKSKLAAILLILVSISLISSCKKQPQPTPTLSPQQLAQVQTRSAYQVQTNQAAFQETQAILRGETPIATQNEIVFDFTRMASSETPVETYAPAAPEPTRLNPPQQTAASFDPLTPTTPALTLLPTTTQAEVTSMPTTTDISPSPTGTLSPTAEITEIITIPNDWSGSWTVYNGETEEDRLANPLVVEVNGADFLGVVTGTYSRLTFTGTISLDGLSVTGTWRNPAATGRFTFFWLNENQFNGNTSNAFAFCGARNLAEQPSPCFTLTAP